MKRPFGAVVALLLLAGCRAPTPPNDPFLYRSTIPPPGTIVPGAPAAAQPYYPAAPPGTVPGPTTLPPAISPGTPLAPSVAPLGPAAVPVAPAPAPINKYSPPGGFNPQSSLQPPVGIPQQPNGTPGRASGPDDNAIVADNWQAPPTNPPANVAAAPPREASTTAATPAVRPEPSVVRIVEPTSNHVANNTNSAPPPGSSPPADTMPATVSLATVTSAPLAQVVARPTDPAVPEITDLPAASGAAAANAQPSASTAMPVNLPAERPGASYGYDPDYKTLRGKLEYSVASRRWKLIYLPPDGAIDEYGGNVVLPDPSQLNGFEAGDFVSVTGTFSPPTAGGGPAMFTIQRIKRQ